MNMLRSFSEINHYLQKLSLQKIVLGIVTILILLFLFFQTQSVSIKEHNRYNGELLRFKEIDAIFDQDIVKVRQGLILHYDPLVADLNQLKQLRNSLEGIPNYISKQGKNEIKQKLADYSQLLNTKETLTESFKSQYATLKNSLSYFPIIATESLTKIANQGGNQTLGKELNLFLQHLLLYNLSSSEDLVNKIQPEFKKIQNNRSLYVAILGSSNFDIMMAHAKIIITNKPQVDALIREITSLPTLIKNEAIYQAYNNYYQNALNLANAYRILLFLIVILLLGYVGYFIEIRRRIIQQIKQTVGQVNTLVEENDGDIRQLSEEAYRQSQEISHTLNSVEQMTRSIQAVAENAKEAAAVADTSSKTAAQGGQAMEQTVESFFSLRDTLTETNQKIEHLTESSTQISQIIALIEHIAKQTKMLSLNASIEAAKAGKEGIGFKAIAQEINRLSVQTGEATQQVTQMVNDIQKDTQAVVKAIELGNSKILSGNYLVENTKQSLEEIINISHKIDELVKSISDATVSQAHTSQSVTELIKQIAVLSERTSNSSRQVANSLQQTVIVAQKLQESVS